MIIAVENSDRQHDRIKRRATRDVRPNRVYSYARAGALWVPRHCIGGGPAGSFAARGQVNAASSTPLDWPRSNELEAWYHWRYDRTFHDTLYATGTGTPPAITQSGTIPINLGFVAECNVTGGARGTWAFRYSTDNGVNWEGGGSGTQFPSAATFNLNAPFSSVQIQIPLGTATVGDKWVLKISQFRDQTGNGHHFVDGTGTPVRLPVPLVSTYGTLVSFDGSDDIMSCTDGMANTLVGGADNPFVVYVVAKLANTSPTSGAGALFFMGNSANNRSMHCYYTNTPHYIMRKWDDAGTAVNVTGGTPNTSSHVIAFRQTGTTAQIFVDGTSVVGPTAQDLAGMTGFDNCAIGGSFLSGARGNHGAHAYYAIAAYREDQDVATIQDLSARYKADAGFP